MGFISGTTGTITVQAKLTDYGKEIIHGHIDGYNLSDIVRLPANPSGKLITRFALGDSDIDYEAIEAYEGGKPTVGEVPEASAFRPTIRSFVLQEGTFRPGVPIMFVNGSAGPDPLSVPFSVPDAAPGVVEVASYTVATEWPRNSEYNEVYDLEVLSAEGGSITDKLARKAFIVTWTKPNSVFRVDYHRSALTADERSIIETVATTSDISIVVNGTTTNKARTITARYSAA